jgi:hypothetical protein
LKKDLVVLSSKISVKQVVQIKKDRVFNQVVIVGVLKKGFESKIHEVRSPGVQATRDLFNDTFQVDVDYSKSVFATTILSRDTDNFASSNGLLKVESKNDFTFDVLYSLMASAVSAERIILEAATEMVFKRDSLGFGSRKHLARLSNWLNIPSSDSTKLISEVRQLRAGLDLNDRTEQVSKVLSNRIRPVDYSIAAFVGTLGVASSLLRGYTLPTSYSEPDSSIETILTFLTAIVVSSVTYAILRRK